MRNKKVIKTLYSLLVIVFIALSAYSLYRYINQEKENKNIKNNIKEEVSLIQETLPLEYYKKYYLNEDIVGSLKIDGTNIDTLLVKATDNNYYLNHNLKKEYDEIGSIFVDYRVDLDSKQINIYGHNSNVYDVMFKELEKYLSKDFYENHKYITIWNGNKTIVYEIFSVQVITNNYEYMNVDSTDWDKHIEELNKSLYKTNITATTKDDILVIQTCNYNPINSFLIINSKKIF
jgi:sortase B